MIQNLTACLWMAVIVSMVSCSGQNDSKGEEHNVSDGLVQAIPGQPIISFDTLYHDFGTIIEGERVICFFEYMNSGTTDLVLKAVEATCGCTTPDWSSEPLKPGENEYLKIVFDATGRSGAQIKPVTVKSNAGNPVIKLTIRANVISSV